MKFLLIMTLYPMFFFSQKKDTIENNLLSLHYNANNDLVRVVERKTDKEFTGWGKFKSYDGMEYRYYENNKLLYLDFRDFNDKILKRVLYCDNYRNCLEELEFYDYNINTVKRRYFICVDVDDEGEIVENKCGKYSEYYRNSKLKVSGQYQNNKEIGRWIYYDTNGKVSEKINRSK